MTRPDVAGLRALFFDCTLKPSPERSHTAGLMAVSSAIMAANGVQVDEVRAVDHDLAPGVQPDMTRPRRLACALRAGPCRGHPGARHTDLAGRQVQCLHPGRVPPANGPSRRGC